MQVKAYDPLRLSDLGRNAHKGSANYLHRVRGRIGTGVEETVVCVGSLGAELRCAFVDRHPIHQKRIVAKLEGKGWSKPDAETWTQTGNFEETTEEILEERVRAALSGRAGSGDLTTTIELLCWWLHLQSERSALVRTAHVWERLNRIATHLSHRLATQAEWGISIRSVSAQPDALFDALHNEYRDGVNARIEHIAADLDVPRPLVTAAISNAFRHCSVVVVRGPSGFGKSTCCLRYLNDCVPPTLRFEVREPADPGQAQRIAGAVEGHVAGHGLEMWVYMDVLPGTTQWVEVVRLVARVREVRVLISIREEDLRRVPLLREAIHFEEVTLTFGEPEARQLFAGLSGETEFLNFPESWASFPRDGGSMPSLLEFAYFLTRKQSLRTRLRNQARVVDESPRLASVLRAVAVAGSLGARIRVNRLGEAVGLDVHALRCALKELELEHLVRLEQGIVEGLHAIRSEILVDELTDEVLLPRAVEAARLLPAVEERDLEGFLFRGLSRLVHPAFLDAVVAYRPTSWQAVAAILRALLWFDIRTHVDATASLRETLTQKYGRLWQAVMRFDVVGAARRGEAHLLSSMHELEWRDRNVKEALREGRNLISGADECNFDRAKRFLSRELASISAPASPGDWSHATEAIFWVGWWRLEPAGLRVEQLYLRDQSWETLPLRQQAALVHAISYVARRKVRSWLSKRRREVLARFRSGCEVTKVVVTRESVDAHYVRLFSECSQEPGAASNDTMERAGLLRQILPQHKRFGGKGYGYRLGLLNDAQNVDMNQHSGVSASIWAPYWTLGPGMAFHGLVELEERPESWRRYAEAFILRLKLANGVLQEHLESVLSLLASRADAFALVLDEDRKLRSSSLKGALETPVLLPRTSVDEWGFRTGPANSSPAVPAHAAGGSLEPLSEWSRQKAAYEDCLSTYLSRAESALIVAWTLPFGEKGRTVLRHFEQDGTRHKDARLAVQNLAETIDAHVALRREYEERFRPFVRRLELARGREVEELFAIEAGTLDKLLCGWWTLLFHAGRASASTGPRSVVASVDRWLDSRRVAISSALHPDKEIVLESRATWGAHPNTWIQVECNGGNEGERVLEVLQRVSEALRTDDDPLMLDTVAARAMARINLVPVHDGIADHHSAFRFQPKSTGMGFSEALVSPLPQEVPLGVWDSVGVPRRPKPPAAAQRLVERSTQFLHLLIAQGDLAEAPTDKEGSSIKRAAAERAAQVANETYEQLVEAHRAAVALAPPKLWDDPTTEEELIEMHSIFHIELIGWYQRVLRSYGVA